MQANELRFLREMIRAKAGIDLGEDKLYLFEARLLPIAAKLGYKDLPSFVAELMKQPNLSNAVLQQDIIEAMTTNESMFFRDGKPFQYFTDIIMPELKQKSCSNINIWCAACSSGQEPYSISILLEENSHHINEQINITASDIDSQILNKARDGIYNQFEVQRGLAAQLLVKYFTQSGNNWRVNDVVRGRIKFLQHNLMEDAGRIGRFNIVFCRYVLIYFDDATKLKVLKHLANVMEKGAYLLLGGAETLPIGCADFSSHPQERKIFIKN